MKNNETPVNQNEYDGFFKNALAIKGSVTPKVLRNVLFFMVYSGIITYIYHLLPAIALPIGPFEYAGLMMGLVLAFRINAGYDRWWEARKLWGNVVNHCRNLAIIINHYPTNPHSDSKVKLTHYLAAWPYLMKNHLQRNASLTEIKTMLDSETLKILAQASHKPNTLSSLIAHELHLLRQHDALDPFAFLQAEEKRAQLLDCQGGCERILNTPIPFVMAVKSRRFILLFLLALPFALLHVSPFICPVITGLVAYALFSLDQIGIELQNPFAENRLSHLPLNEICNTIHKNISDIKPTV